MKGNSRSQNSDTRNLSPGFTLLEMFLVSIMLAVISLTIYSTFSNGIKIWKKVNTEMPEEDLSIFFERFSFDLRNNFRFEGIDFSGKEDMVEFPALVKDPGSDSKAMGQVVYSYDPASGVLTREQRDFSQIYRGRNGAITQVLCNLKDLKFQYYFYDPQKEEYAWHDECLKGQSDLAVRIQLEFNDREGVKFTRTVAIPVYGQS